jgi:hypothetical protein
MSKRIFTPEEMAKLVQNPNVKKASERSITYAREFKSRAVERYKEGWSAPGIFREAGFDLLMIGRKTPKECFRRWKKVDFFKGEAGFKDTAKGRGRPKKARDATEADKVRRLEIENAYLKAENDFLTRLRAKRAEKYSSRNKSTGSSKD